MIAWPNRNLDRAGSRHRRGSNHVAAVRTFAWAEVIREDGGLTHDCDGDGYYRG